MQHSALIGFFLLTFLGSRAMPQATRRDGTLPGYYEFYFRQGRLRRIAAEVERDEKIAGGEITAQEMHDPLPALALPLESGELLDLGSFRGKKNLVIATYRAWW